MEKNKIILAGALVVIAVIVAGVVVFKEKIVGTPTYVVEEVSDPESEKRQVVASQDVIAVDNITTGSVVTSPLTVTGTVRTQYLDDSDSFLVEVRGMDGTVLGSGAAIVTGDVESEIVSFVATLEFVTEELSTGLLMITQPEISGSRSFGYQVRFAN